MDYHALEQTPFEAWREKVFPLIAERLARECPSVNTYLVLYHEVTIINLLEIMMYHQEVFEAVDDDALLEVTHISVLRITGQENRGECAMARRRTLLEEHPLGIQPPREVPGGVEVSLSAASEGWHRVADWVGIELAENMVYLVTKVEWRAAENGERNPDPRGHMRAKGWLYVSKNGWREFGVRLASGEDPLSMFEGAWQFVWQAGSEFADPGVDDATADLRVAMVGSFELPSESVRMRLPPFLLEKLGGLELVRQAVADLASLAYEEAMVHREYYRAFLEMGPFSGEQKYEVLRNCGSSKSEMAMRRARMSRRPMHPRPPTENEGGWEVSLPAGYAIQGLDTEWRAVILGRGQTFMMVECLWEGMRINRGSGDDLYTDLRVTGTVYLPELGWHMLGTELALGHGLLPIFQRATRVLNRVGQEVRGRRNVGLRTRVEIGGWREFKAPMTGLRCRVPRFMVDLVFGSLKRARDLVDSTLVWIHLFRPQTTGMFYDVSVRHGPDRESAKLEGTREDGKDASIGESSGKAEGSKRGLQENREGGNDMRTSPRKSAGATPKKTKVFDTSHKLTEIEKRTAEFKARLIEQMMVGDEEDLQDAGSREGRRAGQNEARYEGKDDSYKGTPSKKGKDKSDPPAEGTENAMTPPAIDSGTSRLPATPKVTGACDGLWSLRERVLGWFDPEGTPKTREKQRESKEGEGASAAGEAGGSEDGLKKVVATLNRTLNKNQGYLADAKKKLTFDGANITEFLIDYENLAALLKWTEEEKMEHLGQHVSLSLGRDIMAIVAFSGSWKETRNEMMRKYLKAEKIATEAELAAVQRKNYATYNDFLREFTLVALRIPGVTDRTMSKYFLRQFSEFDKDKILSAYQQTSKFEYTRDVDFSTVTDLAEKTVVTETLALLKEGEVIDLTGKTGDKVKKGIESLHERVHGVDSKMDRMENALLVMQAQVSRPALPPQEAVVPAAVANRGFGRRDPTNEQCKYCTMIGHFVQAFRKPLYGDRFLEVSYIYSGGRGRIEILIGASGDITLAEELYLRSVADEEMARCMAYICKIDPAAPLDISYVVPESIATRVLNDEAPDMESQTATLTHEGVPLIIID
ncbi:hypothetical protein CBR_g21781 [Chara braunii]|uniref:Retrotransposon gag domain-containing protein n=1 Tax=Chara braunii TaxID=69332 RepID=A0A388JUF1_CHABU|nr:hypothetical protein CBR_g21781 [Chara braunii]|eukprot:GBG61436.1 hypothetical protein CBR_g21781 [Chara braunii]